jgi:hypothetical protein
MRRLMCWSLVLIVACVAVLPLTGCGSKKAPATIADLLAKAKTNPKPEGRAKDLVKVAGMQITSKDKAGAGRTLEMALAEIPADGQPLVCVPVLVEIAQTYADMVQRSAGKKAVEAAATMVSGVEDPQSKSSLLDQIGVPVQSAGTLFVDSVGRVACRCAQRPVPPFPQDRQ